ncbi:hypothetical protein EVG20_g7162 [Dentipellis fragilis]|uniref:Uncharacterized protein n=1 Tax=Dentipellis fragilis TaxID=205917 RepID=A0A4Y9YJN3_9AGAM|nr:hypothetical protein EVG20_g7162 [Dentipellis fragilis]
MPDSVVHPIQLSDIDDDDEPVNLTLDQLRDLRPLHHAQLPRRQTASEQRDGFEGGDHSERQTTSSECDTAELFIKKKPRLTLASLMSMKPPARPRSRRCAVTATTSSPKANLDFAESQCADPSMKVAVYLDGVEAASDCLAFIKPMPESSAPI